MSPWPAETPGKGSQQAPTAGCDREIGVHDGPGDTPLSCTNTGDVSSDASLNKFVSDDFRRSRLRNVLDHTVKEAMAQDRGRTS